MYYKTISVIALALFIFNAFSQPTQEDINQSRKYFNEGVRYGVDEKYDKALDVFNKAIEINPIYAKAFLYRGLTKTELSKYKEAIRDFTITIELDPGYSDQAHYFRGIAKFKSGDYEGSIRDYSIAIRLNPDFISFFQRGKAYLELKEYGRAMQDFDISYRLNPEFEKIYFHRGKALYYVEQYQASVEDLEKAKQVFPDSPEVFYFSGLARIAMQNSYVAIEDLDRCIELDPNYSEAYLARAQARINTDNPEAAEADKKKAEEILAKAEIDEKSTEPPIKDHDPKEASSETIDIAQFFSSGTNVEPTEPTTLKSIEDDLGSDKREKETETKKEKEITPTETIDKKEIYSIDQLSSGVYNKMLKSASPNGFGIQVASYSHTDKLQNLVSAYEEQFEKPVFINVNYINDNKIYRIVIGQFDDRDNAEEFRDELRKTQFSDCFLISYDRLH